MTRDPRTDPREGDELREQGGTHRVLVDGLLNGRVLFRVVDAEGGLVSARSMSTAFWTLTTAECEAPHD